MTWVRNHFWAIRAKEYSLFLFLQLKTTFSGGTFEASDAWALALLDVNGVMFVVWMFVEIWPRALHSCERSFTLATRTLVCFNSDISVKSSECSILYNSIITIFCKRNVTYLS